MFKTILLFLLAVLAIAVVAVLIAAARRPDSFTLTRTTVIEAPPERIYPLIADFRAWGAWSPWEKKDPNLKRSFGGPDSGKGATYAWLGDKNVGEGRMEIVEASAPRRIGLKLDFVKPFEAHNDVVFALEPEGRSPSSTRASSTRVSWTMTGPTPFFAKIIHVFVDMDRMVGGDFEAGLAAMKAAAER